MSNLNEFLCLGDTHGNHKFIMHKIKSLDIRDTTIIHVGDFGVGFKNIHTDKVEMNSLNKRLEDYNCHMYVIRGNHDNPEYFDGSWDWSNLHLVPDYTVVTVNGDDVLLVGGAISIDRKPRLQQQLVDARNGKESEYYWYDEAFVLDEEKLKEIKGVRYVVTHSCPSFVEPINDVNNGPGSHGWFVGGFCSADPELKDDLNKERTDLTRMYEILKEYNYIDKYIYGHFHKHNAQYYEDTDFVCLGINEFYTVHQK